MNISWLKAFGILCILISLSESCHPQFQRELRYLDLYLGIKPTNEGEVLSSEPINFATYVSNSEELNCDFDKECFWRNAPSDNLLDTSDWWHFNKTDEKTFPVQIQPSSVRLMKGEHFLIAGNTTTGPQGAVLISAPIACQMGYSNLTFNYWLYNHAQVEVVILKAMNRRRHLQVLLRPSMKCDFLGNSNECHVLIPPIKEPFKIGIRAFELKDNTVGSLALLDKIRFQGNICQQSPFPSYFSSLRIPPYEPTELQKISELNCDRPLRTCKWSNDRKSVSNNEWRVGRSVDRFIELFDLKPTEPHPNSSFIFLAVDSFTPRPYSLLESQLIPCSQRTVTLSLRYWMKTGTQAEICAVDEDGVALSCAYLDPEDSPGPINIDLDAYSKPFKFTVGIVAFDENKIGLLAISDLKVSGYLCSEPAPPILTTINPPTIRHLFGLQNGEGRYVPYDLSLDCNFTKDYCSQWVNYDGLVQYGTSPISSGILPIPKTMKGNVAVFVLQDESTSTLRSRQVPCSYNGLISVNYMRSENAVIRLCALDQCVNGTEATGVMTLAISSTKPFFVTIEASSSKNAIVVISSITTNGEFCQLKTAEQTVCEQLTCRLQSSLCQYETIIEKPGDTPLTLTPSGATVTLSGGSIRSVLRSPTFDLAYPSILVVKLSQSTFGSRVLLCPDVISDPTLCHELSGPRVLDSSAKELIFPLDIGVRSFSIILYHDKSIEFGPAKFKLESIAIKTINNEEMCY